MRFCLEKEISADLVHVLAEDELKFIVSPEQHLLLYLKFKKCFIEWKQRTANIPQLNKTQNNCLKTLNTNVYIETDMNNIVEYIVKNKYSDIEDKIHDKNKYLHPAEVRQLLEYIKTYFLKNKLKMELSDMKNIARQISDLFPNEDKVHTFCSLQLLY